MEIVLEDLESINRQGHESLFMSLTADLEPSLGKR
jgi:hypothetical protein